MRALLDVVRKNDRGSAVRASAIPALTRLAQAGDQSRRFYLLS